MVKPLSKDTICVNLKNNNEMNILAIDTTIGRSSVSVLRGMETVHSMVEKEDVSSSTNLLSLIDKLLFDNGLKISDIDLFASTIGPGSYTGIRIGLSTLKAIAYTMGKLSVGVPTLKALAHASGVSDFTLTVLPAGRDELFVQTFKVLDQDNIIELDSAKCITLNKLLELVKDVPRINWTGLGAELVAENIKKFAEERGKRFITITDNKIDDMIKNENVWFLYNTGYILSESTAILAHMEFSFGQNKILQDLKAEYLRPLSEGNQLF